ncbi:MAG: 5'-3' exonuclease H3TH domain-containing protein [bacterium]|nr:5'-3' exonuclease H3TH domain-containing protein [bacterium]
MKDTIDLFSEIKGRFYLIDSHSYIYRAFYAIRDLKNSKGQMTNAVYGFTNMLLKILKEEKPDYIACAFDHPKTTWRAEEFTDYKIHRKPMPDDLKSQMPYIKEVVNGFNIPIFEMPGFEADDLIGTIAKHVTNESLEVTIVSSDKDILQLVNGKIKVLNDRGEKIYYDRNAVIEKMGVPPENIPDFLALCGDSSDNIPGVDGIGQKGALSLINRFNTIENLIENVNEIKNEKHRRSIIKNKDTAILSKRLAVIKTDVPFDIDIHNCRIKEFNREKLEQLFKELEFNNLINKI